MTVGELKRLLADVPDDAPILVPSFDHSYRAGMASVTNATRQPGHDQWCEYWSEEHLQAGEEKFGPVVVVS